MVDLPKALFIAIGTRALEKHQETCNLCSDNYSCVVANAHLDSLARLRNLPGQMGNPSDD